MSVHVCIYKSIHTHYIVYFLLRRFKAVILSIKLAIISKIKQTLLKKLCDHVRQVLLIKAIQIQYSSHFLAEATNTGIPHQEIICPSIPIHKSSLNRQNIHGKLEKEDMKGTQQQDSDDLQRPHTMIVTLDCPIWCEEETGLVLQEDHWLHLPEKFIILNIR